MPPQALLPLRAVVTEGDRRPTAFFARRAPIAEYERLRIQRIARADCGQIIRFWRRLFLPRFD
jgi:hypothetical protein